MICLVLFRNCHFQNAVSMFTNVVHINVENDNVVSTLSNVVHINVEIHNIDSTLFDIVNSNGEIHNVVSTLIWRCPTSRRRINQKSTLKQRWNICWEGFHFYGQESYIYWAAKQEFKKFKQSTFALCLSNEGSERFKNKNTQILSVS